MRLTTLCYIEHQDKYLMLHRVKKNKDENAGKWIGIGGHLEENESPDACIRREILEETGLEVTDLHLRGILTFILPRWGNELSFLYTASIASPPEVLPECREGVLAWVPKEEVLRLNLWEGDRFFLPLLSSTQTCFSVKLVYDNDDVLKNASLES